MKKRGFTLIELLVAASIFAMLLGGIIYALGGELNIWKKITSSAANQQIANMVLYRMGRDIREAHEILPLSNQEKLALKIGPEQIEYSLSQGKIKRKKDGYSAYLTDKNDLQQLSFSYPAAGLVEIHLDNFTVKVGLRN